MSAPEVFVTQHAGGAPPPPHPPTPYGTGPQGPPPQPPGWPAPHHQPHPQHQQPHQHPHPQHSGHHPAVPPPPQTPPSPVPPSPVPPSPVPPSPAQPPVPAHAPAPPGATGHFPLPPGTAAQLPPAGPPHPAAPPGPIAVLLIGPAGAGKTTVARHWAGLRPTPTAHISLDDVREWVRAGFANPQSGWNDNSEAQYRLARRTCGFACRNYLANGISCVIDDAVFPDRPAIGLGGWKRHIGPGMIPVVLLPGLESVLARNARRSGTRRLADEEVARIHGRMAGWYNSGLPIIDNSRLDVPATAAELDRVITARLTGHPHR
ncbi:AAA family ATPase [Streptomyces sp. NPDC092296]|uniref:AAA family ATPase n=1 Tax=Streptomyces sp. NPDC092296 TaxID=3366012 RepID=UPI003824DEA9